jgi:cell division protease FtsH
VVHIFQEPSEHSHLRVYGLNTERQNNHIRISIGDEIHGRQELKITNRNRDSQGKNGKKPRNKFSIYWIYALVALIFIGIQYINFGTEPKDIEWNDIRRMVANQDIAKLVVINNKYAEVFIKPEKIKEDTLYKDFKNPRMGGETATGPHFKYKFLTVDAPA